MKKGMMWLLVLAVLSLAADPVDIVRSKDTELQNLLQKKKRTSQDTEKMKRLINDIFDFGILSQKALPSTTWKELTDAQRQEFREQFKRMVENSSVKKLEVYQSDSTLYDPTKIKGDKAKLVAHVWNGGKESILIYKFEKVQGEWRAWDLDIDGLSTARNYREQFSRILKKKSFDDLLEIIRKKANEGA